MPLIPEFRTVSPLQTPVGPKKNQILRSYIGINKDKQLLVRKKNQNNII